MTGPSVYLDYNATTPIDPQVLKVMLPYLTQEYGNPSSGHSLGKRAKSAVEDARSQVAFLLGCKEAEVVFTSGVTEVPVDSFGSVDPPDVAGAIRHDTILVTIMHANNEVGTIQRIKEIAAIAFDRGIPMHTDAAQSAGKIPVRVGELGVNMLTMAGHKVYAPKGVGALYVGGNLALEPLMHGAGHESGRRAGTENVAGIVGLGMACHIAGQDIEKSRKRATSLRDRLHHGILKLTGKAVLNGHPTERLPNTLNMSFLGLNGADILAGMPEVAASTGSACHDRQLAVSGVLLAMGADEKRGAGSVRFSLGRYTTEQDIDLVLDRLGLMLKN
ncbi:MAG: cysteine desulfurase family protein [Dehalococcoidia bacterium]|nr:cysteine desulfurase family protein [Dehalococcoidia bacterium]